MLPPKKILSPIDFSTHSDDALNAAAELASRFDAELCLVHVVPMIPSLPSFTSLWHEADYEKELHAEAQRRLDGLAQSLIKRGIRASSVVGTANEVGMEIIRIAEHEHADLIVIATHGMTGWHKLAFGSVAEKVVRLATCAVLVIRVQPTEHSASDLRDDSEAASKTVSKTVHSALT